MPAIGVQGRWVVNASMVGERQAMISVTEYLTGEARKQLTQK